MGARACVPIGMRFTGAPLIRRAGEQRWRAAGRRRAVVGRGAAKRNVITWGVCVCLGRDGIPTNSRSSSCSLVVPLSTWGAAAGARGGRFDGVGERCACQWLWVIGADGGLGL